MAQIVLTLNSETHDCILTINGIAVNADSIELYKYYGGPDNKPMIGFCFSVKTTDPVSGMEIIQKYMLMTPHDDPVTEDGYAEVAGVKMSYIILKDTTMADQLKEFLSSRKKKNKKRWGY